MDSGLATSRVFSNERLFTVQTIIGCDVASFLSIPILHTHQEKTRVLKRRKTSSIFYEPDKETESAGEEERDNSVAQNGGARPDTAPCVALLVCLVNKSVSSSSSSSSSL